MDGVPISNDAIFNISSRVPSFGQRNGQGVTLAHLFRCATIRLAHGKSQFPTKSW